MLKVSSHKLLGRRRDITLPRKIIQLEGRIPSKKNLLRRGRGGRMFTDTAARTAINSLTIQAVAQWVGLPPVDHPELTFALMVIDKRSDRDNMVQTLMDVLGDAGVLVQDNIAHCNGTMVIRPAIVGDTEGAEIEIGWWTENERR